MGVLPSDAASWTHGSLCAVTAATPPYSLTGSLIEYLQWMTEWHRQFQRRACVLNATTPRYRSPQKGTSPL